MSHLSRTFTPCPALQGGFIFIAGKRFSLPWLSSKNRKHLNSPKRIQARSAGSPLLPVQNGADL